VFALDYRGLSVPQAAELRGQLRDVDTTLRVVKNTLTERAADEAGAEGLKSLLAGPTALAFVRGDAALAAKALRDYGRRTELLPFKGGILDGTTLDSDQVRSIAGLPPRDVLYGQLVGVVAHPISGLARTLNALISGLAVALGQIQEQGLVGGNAPAPGAEPAPAAEVAQDPPEDPDAGPASRPDDPQPSQAEGDDISDTQTAEE
jgi:large subunit ribosomal protein L10